MFVAPGLAVMGLLIGLTAEGAVMPLLGVAALVAFVGIGLLTAARFLERARRNDEIENRQMFR
jgi:MFS superfamily sulfate permease-like transporter